MSEFRNELYQVYVSKFAISNTLRNESAKRSYMAWAQKKYLPLLKNISIDAPILELGCGPGNFLQFLREKGFCNAQGIDVSAEQAAIAKSYNLDVSRTDVFAFLEKRRRAYDIIVAIDFIEHFTRDELKRLLPLIYTSLRSRGRLIISTPNGQGLIAGKVIFGDLTHMTVFTPNSLSQLLHLHGFRNELYFETGPVAKNSIGLLRVVIWKWISLAAKAIKFIQSGQRQDIWTDTFLCLAFKDCDTSQSAHN